MSEVQESDAAELLQLSAEFNVDNPSSDEVSRQKMVEEAIQQHLAWVVRDGDRLIGYALCQLFAKEHHYFPNSVFFAELYVKPEYRSKGLGEQLIRQALAGSFPQEYTSFSLTHDPEKTWLSDYYARFGFHEVGTTAAGNVMMTRSRI